MPNTQKELAGKWLRAPTTTESAPYATPVAGITAEVLSGDALRATSAEAGSYKEFLNRNRDWESLDLPLRKSVLNHYALTFQIAELAQPLPKFTMVGR